MMGFSSTLIVVERQVSNQFYSRKNRNLGRQIAEYSKSSKKCNEIRYCLIRIIGMLLHILTIVWMCLYIVNINFKSTDALNTFGSFL